MSDAKHSPCTNDLIRQLQDEIIALKKLVAETREENFRLKSQIGQATADPQCCLNHRIEDCCTD